MFSLTPGTSTTEELPATGRLGKVVVTSDLDVARTQIAPSLGATSYTQTPAQIQNIPGGENAPFQQVLLRAPGVVEDSFGQEHIRGEHANLTYRINGVLLPQPLNGFGQELDTRLIQSFTLIGGTSLLIVVGVAIETMQAIEAQLLMRNYEGFIKGGG